MPTSTWRLTLPLTLALLAALVPSRSVEGEATSGLLMVGTMATKLQADLQAEELADLRSVKASNIVLTPNGPRTRRVTKETL